MMKKSVFLVLHNLPCSLVGAVEANLIHVHSAVYALFLCLYGMFPCYFMKYLQHYFQPGSSVKGRFIDKLSFCNVGEKQNLLNM